MAENAKRSRLSKLALANKPRLRMLGLAITVAATFFLLWQGDEPPLSSYSDAKKLRGDAEPDGFVINGSYTSYDEVGNRKIVFTSPRIEQFEEGNVATMEFPRAELFGTTGEGPWVLNAENGKLRQNEDLLYLTGKVNVVRTIGDREATLKTESLTLDNKKGTVYTGDPVEITDSVGTTSATGMKAWIDERILELNSQVKGRYETAQ
ncbi:LPS export ABC transporter periplasmic protein LptC [Marinobacter salexigens]|jgi:lipopolysaccharide export system protein LptC|uniref:Lipopolysaccharide export system protein LptC n=1 Tax=Marinobacter salexigens TaxID=1925763 RepID=A0ABS6A9K1_9GAMM|nr:LPS export ABC transporter periplasmic protein LptC [Marinobacter salexigens]MBU2874798.1 LPS export ABC transporter periplasmic protein LptC [Marinobacter salexigens]